MVLMQYSKVILNYYVLVHYIMWLCKRCGFKNNNTNEKCHGIDCNAIREYEAILQFETQTAIENRDHRRVLDKCPKCKKDTIFVFKRMKAKRKIFNCTECNSSCFQIGKSKPVPEGESFATQIQ